MADNKRDALEQLYRHDNRVAPWAGTAQGVLQAVNTYEHHEGTVRGATRAERNLVNAINGTTTTDDRLALAQLMALVSAA